LAWWDRDDGHVDARRVGAVQRALFNGYPTVTVINIADVIETIQGVVRQIPIVVRFLAGFSILAGAVILASSIASTQFRRVREVVVLKTLGAKRNHIAAVFSLEFIVLGLLVGFYPSDVGKTVERRARLTASAVR
jgi:putative ABC transport system permease protein